MKRALLLLLIFVAAIGTNAKTVLWSVTPQYQSLTPFSETLFLAQKSDKWGIIDRDGNVVVPIKFDFITMPNQGPGIAGVVDGFDYLIKGFVNPDGTLDYLNGNFYVVPEHQTFSEGKLCVSNKRGARGFINRKGAEVVRCQFDEVHPFKEGFASVRDGNWVYYITDSYDRDPSHSVMRIDWRNGEITFGSSFRNGEAVVGYGNKFVVIDLNGRRIRDYGSAVNVNPDYTVSNGYGRYDQSDAPVINIKYDPSISVTEAGGKYGYKEGNNIITPNRFDQASKADRDGYAPVLLNGQYGIVKFVNFDFKASSQLNGGNDRTINNDPDERNTITYTVQVPSGQVSNYRLLVDTGNGFHEVKTTNTANTVCYTFTPNIPIEDESFSYSTRLLYDGMRVYESKETYAVIAPIKLNLQIPAAATATADLKSEIQQVYSTLANDSGRDVLVTCTLSVNCKLNAPVSQTFTLAIPAHSTRRVAVDVKVTRDEDAHAVIRLSTGESASGTVPLRVY